MKVSRTWLQRYFETELPSVEKLADALTFHAFEIEEVIGDILDVKVLPDRAGYALSHRGIAKELSAILSLPMKRDPLRESIPAWTESKQLTIKADQRYVLRHTGAVMRGVTVKPSPAWLVALLESVGQRSINNIVDVSNFVMLDIGQPTHAFDAGKISQNGGGYSIAIREAVQGEEVVVLTGEKYALGPNMFVFSDSVTGAALDIAGMKGGLETGVTDATVDLFLSAGNYDGERIRKTSQALGLMTDASQRFQNRPSPELTAYGMRDLIALVLEVAGGTLEGIIDVYPKKPDQKTVSVTPEKISKLLGASYDRVAVEEVFRKLDLPFEVAGDTFTVTPPFERTDLSIPEDLVEEVGRIVGYAHIKPEELPRNVNGALPDSIKIIEAVKDLLVSLGCNEVSTYALLPEGDLELAKPLAEDKKFLRTNLWFGHKKAATHNAQYVPLFNLSDVRLFEIGRIWPKGVERAVLGITYLSTDKQAGKKQKEFFTHVTTALSALLGKEVVGMVTEYTLEFNVEDLLEGTQVPDSTFSLSHEGQYHPFSVYPFALRDVAVWTPEGTEAGDIEKIVRKEAGDLLVRIDLFDEFKKDGQVSYAFRLVFQAFDRTLSEPELTGLMERVTKALNAEPGYTVR